MLVARDDQSCLIVSYKDIRKAIDMAYMSVSCIKLKVASETDVDAFRELLQSSGVIR